jgi:hypothetical protein
MYTVREYCKEFKMYRKRKDIRKNRHLAAFVFIPSDLGRSFQTSEPVLLNVYGAPELIPRNEFRQPM